MDLQSKLLFTFGDRSSHKRFNFVVLPTRFIYLDKENLSVTFIITQITTLVNLRPVTNFAFIKDTSAHVSQCVFGNSTEVIFDVLFSVVMSDLSDNSKENFPDEPDSKMERADSDDNNSTTEILHDTSSCDAGDKCSSNTANESDEEGLEYEGGLPLEVITTVSKPMPTAGPILKVKSNGVLTHRNIFTDTERAVLKDIVVNYQDIVDTRSRSRETFVEKQQAWQKIVVDYNDRPGMAPRTVKELRKCWDNMKYRARQAEKEFQQKSIHEQGYLHMLSFGDVSITKEGMSLVNSTREVESPLRNEINSDMEIKPTLELDQLHHIAGK